MAHPESERTCPHCDQLHPAGTDYCPKTGRPVADVASRMIGRTLAGKYRLIRCIGGGGMGTIFEAEHTVIGSRVAVKLLHEPFAFSREPVQRLYREGRAAAAIGHPNIIKVMDILETDQGIPFLVMELLVGESLGDRLDREGPMTLGECLDIGIQMIRALAAAHESGVVHRDLKSDNVFLSRDGAGGVIAKLLDFGISKREVPQREALGLTQSGAVLGTPYYMAPEQAEGRRDLDHRIDIYSAGVIVYEMLVGNLPHRASNYNALLVEILKGDIARPSSIRSDVPRALEKVVMKALARHREDRWASCAEFARALETVRDRMARKHALSRGEIGDRPSLMTAPPGIDPSATPAAAMPRRPSRRFVIAGTAAVVAAVVGSVANWGAHDNNGMKTVSKDGDHEGLAPVIAEGTGGDSKLRSLAARIRAFTESPEPKTIRLSVETRPRCSRVTLDGQLMQGDSMELDAVEEPVILVVEAPGYEPYENVFVPDEDKSFVIQLEQSEKEKGRQVFRTKRGKRTRYPCGTPRLQVD